MSWIDVKHELPLNEWDEFDGNVIGIVNSPMGKYVEFVHFDGDSWYTKDSKSCTVTHWMPINFDYLTSNANENT